MGWVESIGILYGMLAVGFGFTIWGLRRGDSEIEEFPFKPLPPHRADKLKIAPAQRVIPLDRAD